MKGLSLSLGPNYQLVTMENRSSFSEKGQLRYDVQENCSLTSQDRNFEIMGQTNYDILDPFWESIPLKSIRLSSPPYSEDTNLFDMAEMETTLATPRKEKAPGQSSLQKKRQDI